MFLFYYYKTTSSMSGDSNSIRERRMNKFQFNTEFNSKFNSKFKSNANSNSNPFIELVISFPNKFFKFTFLSSQQYTFFVNLHLHLYFRYATKYYLVYFYKSFDLSAKVIYIQVICISLGKLYDYLQVI